MTANDRVLVADDDPQVREMLRDLFAEHGYEVELAEDGAAARVLLGERGYDILVLDVQMPQFNGIEVLAELRKRKIATPVVMISGNATDASRNAVRDLGPAVLVQKPFELEPFLDRVREVREVRARPAGATTALRVLVADDHEPTRSLLAEFLTESGCTVVAVADGEGALRAAAEARPPFDVAILDVIMPGLPGHEAVDRLRRVSPETVPMIITGEATQDQIRKGYQDGAVTLLRKPIDLQVLLRVLRSLQEESTTRHKQAQEQRDAAAAPAHRRLLRGAMRWLKARPGTAEYRQAITAAVAVVAVALGLLLTRIYLVVQEEAQRATGFADKMEEHAQKVEEYLEWDKRHKEDLTGKRRPPDGSGPK